MFKHCFLQGTSTEDGEMPEVLGGQNAKDSVRSAPPTQDKQTNWSKENIPPSDQISDDSNAVSSCIIPINVTGKLQKKRKKSV